MKKYNFKKELFKKINDSWVLERVEEKKVSDIFLDSYLDVNFIKSNRDLGGIEKTTTEEEKIIHVSVRPDQLKKSIATFIKIYDL